MSPVPALSSQRWTPVGARALGEALAAHAVGIARDDAPLRVLIDGPRSAPGSDVANAMVEPLRALGRQVLRVSADGYWRDASVRLEYGREDVESYYSGWLDLGAMRREVLDPLGPSGSRRVLPALRDPITNRATRSAYLEASEKAVLLVDGDMLLGVGLPAELTVHLQQSPAARARRVPPEWAWTLPASAQYDSEVAPADIADIVVRADDPAHLAVRLSPISSTRTARDAAGPR